MMLGMRRVSESMGWACSWEHVWRGDWILKGTRFQNVMHVCFPKQKNWMNKNQKQDTWLFPVNSKRYHFPEVSSSKYGVSEGQKDQGWRLKPTVHFGGKVKEVYTTKRMGRSILRERCKEIRGCKTSDRALTWHAWGCGFMPQHQNKKSKQKSTHLFLRLKDWLYPMFSEEWVN